MIIVVDYIDLMDLDLSKFDDEHERPQLARDFFKAFTEEGFVTISGHGISKEVWDQQMDLANATMTMSPDEKVPYKGLLNNSQLCELNTETRCSN